MSLVKNCGLASIFSIHAKTEKNCFYSVCLVVQISSSKTFSREDLRKGEEVQALKSFLEKVLLMEICITGKLNENSFFLF
jgi:hypothetical protein